MSAFTLPPAGAAPRRGRRLLRWGAALLALALLPLWAALIHTLFAAAGSQPAPAVIMLPVLFLSLALWAVVAALRDEGMLLVLAGGLSFVPIGLFLLFMPGFARWIGVLNLALVGIGVVLLRTEGELPTALDTLVPEPHDPDPTTGPR